MLGELGNRGGLGGGSEESWGGSVAHDGEEIKVESVSFVAKPNGSA